MLLCATDDPLSTFSDIANIVIAVVNLFLAGYIFIYQREKDKRDEASSSRLHDQDIKLQWFRDLIIGPHLRYVTSFYESVSSVSEQLTRTGLTNEEKIVISQSIKAEQAKLRKSFVEAVRSVHPKLGEMAYSNLDKLVDDLTETIFKEGIDLSDRKIFEKEIESRIFSSRNQLMSQIYNFKGD